MTVLNAIVGTNADLFPLALQLYVPEGSRVIDMTWGKGIFWNNVTQDYDLVRNDIDLNRGDVHQDFRALEFEDGSFFAAVFDPPYSGNSSNKSGFVNSLYNNHSNGVHSVDSMLDMYRQGMAEAYRILKSNGVLFVKCMDEIESGKQRRNHITIWQHALGCGFRDEDLFILVREGTPVMRHAYQLHARKNSSFLWVFRKD